MKERVDERVALIKDEEDPELLKKHLCSFFKLGGYPSCPTCRQNADDLETCKDYYLTRAYVVMQDLWSEDFDRFIVKERNKMAVKEVVGIGINCNSCYMSSKCTLHKPDYTCGIEWNDDIPKDTAGFYAFLVDLQYERVKRASIFERIDGGVPDASLSGEMDRLNGLVLTKNNLGRESISINVETTGGASGGGILAKLFGGGGAAEKALPEPSTPITPHEVVEEKTEETKKGPRRGKKE